MNTLPIARARMRVRVTLPSKDGKRLKDKILALISEVEEDDWSDDWELVRYALNRRDYVIDISYRLLSSSQDLSG